MSNWTKRALLAITFLASGAVAWFIVTNPLASNEISTVTVSAEDPFCKQRVEDFDGYPLVYLGDEFEGLPLLTCHERAYPATDYGIPETRYFVFIYGCVPIDEGESEGCVAQLQVSVFPCNGPRLAAEVTREENLVLRGANASKKPDGTLYLEASAVKVMISPGQHTAEASARVARAVDQLQGANQLTAEFDTSSSFSDSDRIATKALGDCS